MSATYSGFKPLLIEDLKKIMPHRYPFLLLDRVVAFDKEARKMVAIKNVTANEEFFQGHFPEAAMMPGVLMVEALAQACGVLAKLLDFEQELAVLLTIDGVKFRKPVIPGDTLELNVEVIGISARGGTFKAQALVVKDVVCEATICVAFKNRSQLK